MGSLARCNRFRGPSPRHNRVSRDSGLLHRISPPLGRVVYAVTCIYVVAYTKKVESAFAIIAEPNRRAILSLLGSSQPSVGRSVGEIERQLRMPQPTVSKHLRVLREAGFGESTVDAQRRFYRLKPERFQEVDEWLAQFRQFWSAHLDALERHLDSMAHSTATTRPAKKLASGKESGGRRSRTADATRRKKTK